MDKYSRSLRRHHNDRIHKHALKVVHQSMNWSLKNSMMSYADFLYSVVRIRNNLKACSCWMCGNPRRKFRDNLTMQEKRENVRYKYEVQEVDFLHRVL